MGSLLILVYFRYLVVINHVILRGFTADMDLFDRGNDKSGCGILAGLYFTLFVGIFVIFL